MGGPRIGVIPLSNTRLQLSGAAVQWGSLRFMRSEGTVHVQLLIAASMRAGRPQLKRKSVRWRGSESS